MTPLEKVARAICRAHRISIGFAEAPDYTLTDEIHNAWQDFLPEASAALTALLDPDEGTVEAAARSIDRIEDCTGYYGAAPGLARAAFNAAIQHILKGAEG
jgi:hypothetical protein